MRFFMLGLLSIGYSIIFFLGVIRLKLGFFVNAICRGNRTVKLVTLTFDDGPDPEATPALLEVLKRHGIKAVFFPTGIKIKNHPEIIEQIDGDGHIIGNHSFRHAWWTNFLISKALNREIKMAQEAIETVIGKIPAYFRPPMGLTNPHLRRALKGLGLSVVGWDIRPFDIGTGNDRVIKRILKKLRNGSIILLHDSGRTPTELVCLSEALVSEIKARGFTFGDPEQLIGERAYRSSEKSDLKESPLVSPNCFGPGLIGPRWFLRPFVLTIASIAYVRRALEKPVTLDVFKIKPAPKFIFGVGFVLVSYVLGWPMVGLFGFLAGYLHAPGLLMVGPAFYGFSHLVWLFGMYLAGRDCIKYGDILLSWGLRKAVEKMWRREA
jgi:peptidoglycan/xylan/chitin deacetylase (PgdA/CDA1 family)